MKRLIRKQKVISDRTVKHRHSRVLIKLATALAIVLVAAGIYMKVQPYTYSAKIRRELESKTTQLETTKSTLEQQKIKNALEAKKQQQKLDKINKELQKTKKELEAKRESQKVYAETPPEPPVIGVTNCGDNPYKQFIYHSESGCRTSAVNEIGACGIGQALPCSKMPCSLSDWKCQDNFFTSYMTSRYGSWQAAYNFWIANHYW